MLCMVHNTTFVKMLLNSGIILILATGTLMFHQHDYNIKFERLEVSQNKRSFISYAKTNNFKYNRTYTAVNITLQVVTDIMHKIEVVYQAYKSASNEYRLFPLRYMDNFCTAIARNDYGFGQFKNCGNFTTCPPKRGFYKICNWAPNVTQFPPHIPNGNYKIQLDIHYNSEKILQFEVYGEVSRPISWN